MNWGKSVYVVKKDIENNRIVLGERDALLSPGLVAGGLNLFTDRIPTEAKAKIRYAHEPAPCRVSIAGDRMEVHFREPQESVTPGQTVALYHEGALLASGIIQEAMAWTT
jgi:tRNA-specific 2-thiouridylase